jgi:hypothetical protein
VISKAQLEEAAPDALLDDLVDAHAVVAAVEALLPKTEP